MRYLKVKAYQYHELKPNAKSEVIYWLDQDPLEFENDQGETLLEMFSDMTDEEIKEHCEMNGYLFDDKGKPIHHLGEIVEEPKAWAFPAKARAK